MQNYKEKLVSLLSENPVSRRCLSTKLGLSDRAVRNLITELRYQGVPICSSSQADGYWLARDKKEIEQTAREYRSRAIKQLKIADRMLSFPIDGQVEMKDICQSK